MKIVPITLREANTFVENFHRHNKPVQGGKFAIGAANEDGLFGVAIVGRPIARLMAEMLVAFCMDDAGVSGNRWAEKE
jgi:hypothetical protein